MSDSSPNHQEMAHPPDYDYANGSPHLKHAELRGRVEASLRHLVTERLEETGSCRVLEVGAGHGDFTECFLNAGANVPITEMIGPSASRIAEWFRGNPRVRVIHDADATWIQDTSETFDLIACISVLHHIPDYLGFFDRASQLTEVGGSFASWQDPTWYPRRSRTTKWAESAWYYFWRIRQGRIRTVVRTRIRRLRGIYDESEVADMS